MGSWYGFQFNKVQESCDITIEQLPYYPDSIVFDGVDDYGICENFPILTKEKGYTVVALRQYLEGSSVVHGLISNTKNWFTNGAFVVEYYSKNNNYLNNPVSFGAIGSTLPSPNIFTYQTSTKYNGTQIKTGNFEATDLLIVGGARLNGYNANVAIWEIVILDHDATEEELQKIQNYYKQEYPWLFPDQAWTVSGKTNEDTDRATIANITGNGNNLVLSNFGFAENSGYGDYIQNFSFFRSVNLTIWSIENTYKQAKFICLNDSVNNTSVAYWASNEQSSYSNKKWRLYLEVSNPDIEVTLKFNGPNWEVVKSIVLKPGVNEISALSSSEFDSLGKMLSLSISKNAVLGDWFLIQQIPEYEGYLVTDGVDDKIISSNFKFGENYTVVGEWKFLQEASNVAAGFLKDPNYWGVFNYKDGISALIKTDAQASFISGVHSIKASTSKGDIYPDFNSYVKIEPGKRIESQYALNIAVNRSIFTKLAFKNLAIYPTVLSKEDCIKSYIYLQTLKEK